MVLLGCGCFTMMALTAFHLDGLREESLPISEPTTLCEYVEAC